MDWINSIVTALLMVGAYFIGRHSVGKPKEVKSPMKVIQRYKEVKQAKVEVDKLSKMLQNVDNYDGTPQGQMKL